MSFISSEFFSTFFLISTGPYTILYFIRNLDVRRQMGFVVRIAAIKEFIRIEN